MTASIGAAGAAVQSAADIYIDALRAHRDQLEITVAGLRYRLAAAEAEVATLKARAEPADAATDDGEPTDD